MLHIQVFEVTFTELVTEAVTISKIRKKVPYRKQNSTSNGALIKVISNYWCQVHALSTVVFCEICCTQMDPQVLSHLCTYTAIHV